MIACGALISPTSPPIPAAAMKGMKLPKNLKADMNPRNMQVRPGRTRCPLEFGWRGCGVAWNPRAPAAISFSSPPPTMQQNLAQMSRMLPPHLLKAMGGAGGLQNLMKQMEGKF